MNDWQKNTVLILLVCLTVGTSIVLADQASNNLILEVGNYVKGRVQLKSNDKELFPSANYTMTFSVDALWTDKFSGKKVYEISTLKEYDNYYSYIYPSLPHLTEEQTTTLVMADSRRIALNVYYEKIVNDSNTIELQFDIDHDLSLLNQDMEELVIVRYNGQTMNITDTSDPLINILKILVNSLIFVNTKPTDFEMLFYWAVSPEVEIGDTIDYGITNGTVLSFEKIAIGKYEYGTFKVHATQKVEAHNGMTIYSPEITAYYDIKTGLVLKYETKIVINDFVITETFEPIEYPAPFVIPFNDFWLLALPFLSIIALLRRRK